MPVIPNRFRREVQLHLLNNYAAGLKNATPLILGIDGAPGDGKTFQCNAVLQELQCSVVSLSASDFGSMYESNAANYVVQKYREVAAKPMPVLVLHDVDTAIGNWGKLTQYTANRQFVLNELMHLCDCPENPHDIPAKRVPIIMTGNDFMKMYAPLVRFGRMRHFEWVPNSEERLEIVSDILYPLPESVCRKVFFEAERQYANQIKKVRADDAERARRNTLPISFYSQLRVEIVNAYLAKCLERAGWYQTYSKTVALAYDLYDEILSGDFITEKDIFDILAESIRKHEISSFV